MKRTLAALLVFTAIQASAQTTAFPDGATTPNADDIQKHLAGKTFDVKISDGSTWHVKYDAAGGFEFKSSKGFADHGDWKAEDGKVCSKGTKIPYSCSDVRLSGDTLYLKRDNGEIVQFVGQQ